MAGIGKEDPLSLLLGMMGNPERGIEESLRNGQSELNGEAVIPSRFNHFYGDGDKLLTEMGFTLSGKLKGDPLFRRALLPEGWRKKATSHHLWSHIIDTNGFVRFEIFFSSVMWDREAFMNACRRIYTTQQYREGEKEDGPKLEDRGITRWRVLAVMPNGGEKNIREFERPIAYREGMTDEERKAYYKQSDELQAEAKAWMVENYPEYENPLAYWDLKL